MEYRGPGDNGGRRAPEEKSRQVDLDYRALVQNAHDLISILGPDGTIIYESPAVEPMLGYRPEELLNKNGFEYLHPEEIEWLSSELAGLLEYPGASTSVEFRFRHKDGSWRHLEGVARNMLDDPGVGDLVNVRNLTERKRDEARLRASEELFRLTFEAAAVGMAHVAPDGRWLRINDKLCEIVGYGQEEMLSLTFQDITHRDDLDRDLEHARRVLLGEIETYSMEKRYVRKDGSLIWIKLTVSLVRHATGEPEYFISVVDEITERKLKELVPDPLTPREMEVLGLIARWQSNEDIARTIGYSVSTVKQEVQHIIAKLKVKNRSQAATKAVKIGLILPLR